MILLILLCVLVIKTDFQYQIAEKSIIIKKGTNPKIDSYSAFFDNKRISETSLSSELHKQNIKRVFICGVASDVCVNYTAFDAHDLGFEVCGFRYLFLCNFLKY